MSLINCKVELSLNWIGKCVLTTAASANKATFKITDAKLYVLIVTLSAEDNYQNYLNYQNYWRKDLKD